MKKTTNQQAFDDLPDADYFKTNEIAGKHFRDVRLFPTGALGFDDLSDGFIALHRTHSPSGLKDEIVACLLLKNMGFGVVLLDEKDFFLAPDAQIGNRIFEIKRLAYAKNVDGAIREHFRSTYRKAQNLFLHIDQPVRAESLRNAIFNSVKEYSKIQTVWVLWTGRLWQLNRKVILNGEFKFR